jgi:tryptophan synthase alpha chain
MSRLDDTFRRLRADGRTGLVTYVTAGDPDLERTAVILRALQDAGADVIEVGVPFSDPLADGIVIQRAVDRALAAGVTLSSTLQLIGRLRDELTVPIILFSYANPLLRMGLPQFATRAAEAGVDGVLALDLPIEEWDTLRTELARAAIDPIFLLSPTTTMERIRRAAATGRGFLYAISRLGVTGEREAVPTSARDLVARIRSVTDLPVALGFGISRPEHLTEVGRWADAAVVGSGLVRVIEETGGAPVLRQRVLEYVQWLRGTSETATARPAASGAGPAGSAAASDRPA